MEHKKTTRKAEWPNVVLPHVVAAGSAIGFGYLATASLVGPLVGALVYVMYAGAAPRLLTVYHREGLAMAQQGKYHKAIEAHQESYRFFRRYAWLDSCRALLLIPSSTSYAEMALLNIAHCYGLYGDRHKSKAYYKRCLHDFPHSEVAKAALASIRAAKAAGIDEAEEEAMDVAAEEEITVRIRST